jgi:hypothetical protein
MSNRIREHNRKRSPGRKHFRLASREPSLFDWADAQAARCAFRPSLAAQPSGVVVEPENAPRPPLEAPERDASSGLPVRLRSTKGSEA